MDSVTCQPQLSHAAGRWACWGAGWGSMDSSRQRPGLLGVLRCRQSPGCLLLDSHCPWEVLPASDPDECPVLCPTQGSILSVFVGRISNGHTSAEARSAPPSAMSEGILALLGRLDFGISEVPALSGSTTRLHRLTMAEGRARRSENHAGFSRWAMEDGPVRERAALSQQASVSSLITRAALLGSLDTRDREKRHTWICSIFLSGRRCQVRAGHRGAPADSEETGRTGPTATEDVLGASSAPNVNEYCAPFTKESFRVSSGVLPTFRVVSGWRGCRRRPPPHGLCALLGNRLLRPQRRTVWVACSFLL